MYCQHGHSSNQVALVAAILAACVAVPAVAADADPCAGFTWNVSRERVLMQKTPEPVRASVQASSDVPEIGVDKAYELDLAAQSSVQFVVPPGRSRLDEGSQAGLLQFRVPRPGRYRIALSSAHWIDVVDAGRLIESRDFQGRRGCDRPHKVVEFELPAHRQLILQLSGDKERRVTATITSVIESERR